MTPNAFLKIIGHFTLSMSILSTLFQEIFIEEIFKGFENQIQHFDKNFFCIISSL